MSLGMTTSELKENGQAVINTQTCVRGKYAKFVFRSVRDEEIRLDASKNHAERVDGEPRLLNISFGVESRVPVWSEGGETESRMTITQLNKTRKGSFPEIMRITFFDSEEII